MALEENLTRRQVLKAAIGGAAGLIVGAPRVFGQADSAAIRLKPDSTTQLADDLFVIRIPGEANVVAHTSSAGVLLVDGGSARAADAVMKAVAGLPGGGQVHTLFNTHWHPEQTGLNEQIGKAEDDHRAGEHAAVAGGRRDVAVERADVQEAAEDRAAEQDVLRHKGQLDSGIRYGYILIARTPTAICMCTSRSRTCSPWVM